jgi:hypothetical protein
MGEGMWKRIGWGLCLALVVLCPLCSQESGLQGGSVPNGLSGEFLQATLRELNQVFADLETNSHSMKKPVESLSFSLPELSRSWMEVSRRLELFSNSLGRIEGISTGLLENSQKLEVLLTGLQSDLSGIRSDLNSVSERLRRSEESEARMKSWLDEAGNKSENLRKDLESVFRTRDLEVWIWRGIVGVLLVERVSRIAEIVLICSLAISVAIAQSSVTMVFLFSFSG